MEFRGTRKVAPSENRREEKQNSLHCGSQPSPRIPESNRIGGPRLSLFQKAGGDFRISASVAGCPLPWHPSLLQALEFPAPASLPRYNFYKNHEPLQKTPALLRKGERVVGPSTGSSDPSDARRHPPQKAWTESPTPQVDRTAPANILRPVLLALRRAVFSHSMLCMARCENPEGRSRDFLPVA